MLTKLTVETVLNDEHLVNEKHFPPPSSHNDYARMLIVIDDGVVPIDAPGDHESSFEPKLVRKHQTHL